MVRSLVIVIALTLFGVGITATIESSKTEAALASGPSPVNLCLALDDSTSMWTDTGQGPASDPGPNPLRFQAARVAISLLGTDVNDSRDSVGAVLFGTSSELGQDIVMIPLTMLTSNSERELLTKQIEDSLWQKGYTRIDIALAACLLLFQGQMSTAEGTNHVILLTDGVPASGDPRYDGEAQLSALSETLTTYSKEEWAVDVILLGAVSETDMSSEVASTIAERSGGSVYAARKPTDLVRIYTQIVSTLTGRDFAGGEPLVVSTNLSVPITVPPLTDSLSITVVKSDPAISVSLSRPGGSPVPPSQVAVTSTGFVETLTVSRPSTGTWQLNLNGDGDAYVSTVMRAVAPTPVQMAAPSNGLPRPADGTSGSGATPLDDGGPSAGIMIQVLFRAVAILLILAVGWGLLWQVRGWLRSRSAQGYVALAEAPARTVNLRHFGRNFRRLRLIQLPIPVDALLAELGAVTSSNQNLFFRSGRAFVERELPDPMLESSNHDGPVHIRSELLPGETYVFGEPAVNVIFGRKFADIPNPRIELSTAHQDEPQEAGLNSAYDGFTPGIGEGEEPHLSDDVIVEDAEFVLERETNSHSSSEEATPKAFQLNDSVQLDVVPVEDAW